MSRYLRAYLGRGVFGGRRILAAASVEQLLTDQGVDGNRIQGLTWYADTEIDGEPTWGDVPEAAEIVM